jgi:hypothetical protein
MSVKEASEQMASAALSLIFRENRRRATTYRRDRFLTREAARLLMAREFRRRLRRARRALLDEAPGQCEGKTAGEIREILLTKIRQTE